MAEGEEKQTCSNCDHAFDAICSICFSELGCGRVSKPCVIEGCKERIISEYGYYLDTKLVDIISRLEPPKRETNG